MKVEKLLLFEHSSILALNQYLGCFIDYVENRDLEVFVGDYKQITPAQCVLSCQQQNYKYAAIQNHNECRCDHQYGKYGQALDDECNYLCISSDKCGGHNRNSIYTVMKQNDASKTGYLSNIV